MEINHEIIQPINWDVKEGPIFDGFGTPIRGYKRIYRNDNDKTLHIAKEGYASVYNNQFLDMVSLLKEDLGCTLKGQGVFRKGKWLYAQFENNEFANTVITNDDHGEMKGYATLANSHDGSIAFKMFIGVIKIWCTNTFQTSVADKRSESLLSLKHTSGIREKIDMAYESISSIAKVQKKIYAKMNDMATRKTFHDTDEYLKKLHRYEKKPRPINVKDKKLGIMKRVGWTEPRYSGNAKNNMKLYNHLYHDVYNHIEPSNWRMFNCTTHVVDHEHKEHQNKNGYHIFGGGNKLKVNAFNLLNR